MTAEHRLKVHMSAAPMWLKLDAAHNELGVKVKLDHLNQIEGKSMFSRLPWGQMCSWNSPTVTPSRSVAEDVRVSGHETDGHKHLSASGRILISQLSQPPDEHVPGCLWSGSTRQEPGLGSHVKLVGVPACLLHRSRLANFAGRMAILTRNLHGWQCICDCMLLEVGGQGCKWYRYYPFVF